MLRHLLRINKPWKKGDPFFIGEHLGTSILQGPQVAAFVEPPLIGGSYNGTRASALLASAYHLARHNVLLDNVDLNKTIYLRAFASAISDKIDQKDYPPLPRSHAGTLLLAKGDSCFIGTSSEFSAGSLFMDQAIQFEGIFDDLIIDAGLRGTFSGHLNVIAFANVLTQFIHLLLCIPLGSLSEPDRKRLTLAFSHTIAGVNSLF